MMRELVAPLTLDIVRLLGALGLLSLGVTLTLWGLKCRRSGAIVIALFLCLAALVPVALADHLEIPPVGSVAQVQTSGPFTPLSIGDWYTSRNPDAGGPGYHAFDICIPCTVPSTQTITIQLYDPESSYTNIGGAPYPDLDEVRPDPFGTDDTTFTLTGPSGSIVATTTYTPGGVTSQTWVTFTNFALGTDCGVYRLTTTTSDDDDNAWRLRVTPHDSDGVPGTGDEICLGNLQTSYQNDSFGCQTFHFFVPAVPSIRLNNFDLDIPNLCEPWRCTVVYTTPSGTTIPGTASGDRVWNNGGGTGYPPPGGDLITEPEPGWWQATLCMNDNNQYMFDAGGQVYFYEKPAAPDMIVSKDDGTLTFNPDGVLTYTIIYTNAGPGAALDAVLTDTLPLSTTFVSCNGGLSCGYVPPPPRSGIVTFSLGTIIAGDSDSVRVSVHVDPDAPTGTMTNTVDLDYTDIVFSNYPVETDIDVDRYEAAPEPPTPTPTPTEAPEPEPPGPEPPGPEPPEPEPPEPGPPTLTLTPTPSEPRPPTLTPTPTPSEPGLPTQAKLTPTVEVLTVGMLPETGGFPSWLAVFFRVSIIIGAASLLNLTLLEIRGRRGDGKGY